MLFLLDTNAVSDYMQEHAKIDARLRAIAAQDSAVICPVVRGEILLGIDLLPAGKRKDGLLLRAAKILPAFACVSVPESAGDYYARVKYQAPKDGFTLGKNDLWIATTAISWGASLVTRDKDFRKIPGLPVEDWTV